MEDNYSDKAPIAEYAQPQPESAPPVYSPYVVNGQPQPATAGPVHSPYVANGQHQPMTAGPVYSPYVVNGQPQPVTAPPTFSQQVHITQVNRANVDTGGYIAYACCVFWCCNWPLGLIAFCFAMAASSAADQGDAEKAKTYGKASVWISSGGIVLTIILMIVFVAIYMTSDNDAY